MTDKAHRSDPNVATSIAASFANGGNLHRGRRGGKKQGTSQPSKVSNIASTNHEEEANHTHERSKAEEKCQIAMNRDETILLTPSGDVLVCRCQTFSPKRKKRVFQTDGSISGDSFVSDTGPGFCNPCNPGQPPPSPELFEKGFQGLAPQPDLQLPVLPPDDSSNKENSKDGSPLAVVPSFDYSHLSYAVQEPVEEDYVVVPSPPREARMRQSRQSLSFANLFMSSAHLDEDENDAEQDPGPPILSVPTCIPGIPTFLRSLAQVTISQVSAHPLGGHVLLISTEGILFSYGNNGWGQLGIGTTKPMPEPTIVTPLLENGGKAVTCAAGVDHSLVVVEMKAGRARRRTHTDDTDVGLAPPKPLERVLSLPDRLKPPARQDGRSASLHQVYAFGKNDCMKLGLVNPPSFKDKSDYVLLPHRVALCGTAFDNVGGVLQVSASARHSAALVQSHDKVQVYTWGMATQGSAARDVAVPVPRVVEALSSQGASRRQAVSSPTLLQPNEVVASVQVGPVSTTFCVTSQGRCFSFGSAGVELADRGLLGQGPEVSIKAKPTELPGLSGVQDISLGAHHAVATTRDGKVYQWGSLPDGDVLWEPTVLKSTTERIVAAGAGMDLTVLVSQNGQVLSAGKASGRLGQGSSSTHQISQHLQMRTPRPMFGGLHLWR